ncbi:MAG: hypothetical protein IK084_01465 [Bacteroidaceae bacterium]|nr:hypothetical protein [Bacteroidaceae bacterium]
MCNSISAINKYSKNHPDGTCELFDENGTSIGKFIGEINEQLGRFYLIRDKKLYDIILEKGKYALVEHNGVFPI